VKTHAVTLLLALTACGGLPDHWTVTGEAPAHVQEAIEAAQRMAPCDVSPWGGKIEFVTELFKCAGVWAYGCFYDEEDGARIVVISTIPGADVIRTSLIHELGHAAWTRCGMESASHPMSFLEWISSVRTATYDMEVGQP
jgi:hypothetical protein